MSSFKNRCVIFCALCTVVAVHVVYAKLTNEEYRSLLSQSQIRSQVGKRPTSSLVKNPQQKLPPVRTRRGARRTQVSDVSNPKQQQQPRQARLSARQAEVLKKRAQYISDPQEKKRLLQEVEKFGYEPEEKMFAEGAHKIELEQQRAQEKKQELKQREQTLEKQKSAQEEFAGHIALLSDTRSSWKNGMPTQEWVQTALQLLQNQQLIGTKIVSTLNAPIFLLDAITRKYNYFIWELNRRNKQEDAQRMEKIKNQFVWRMAKDIFTNYAKMLNKEKAFWDAKQGNINQDLLNDMISFCCYLFNVYHASAQAQDQLKTMLYNNIDAKYALEKVQEDKLRADKEEVAKFLAQCSQTVQKETAEKQTTQVALETGFETLIEFMKNNKPKNKEEEQENENKAINAAQEWLKRVPDDQRNAVIGQIKKEYREALVEQKWGHVLLGAPNVSKEFASFAARLDALENARFVQLGQKKQQEQSPLSEAQQKIITDFMDTLKGKLTFHGLTLSQYRVKDLKLQELIKICIENKIDLNIDVNYAFVAQALRDKIIEFAKLPNSEKAEDVIQRTLERLQELWKEKKPVIEAIEEIPTVPAVPEGQQKLEAEKPAETGIAASQDFTQFMENIAAGSGYYKSENEEKALEYAKKWLENTPVEQRNMVIEEIKNLYKKALEQQTQPGYIGGLIGSKAPDISDRLASFNSKLDTLKNIPAPITAEEKPEAEKLAETGGPEKIEEPKEETLLQQLGEVAQVEFPVKVKEFVATLTKKEIKQCGIWAGTKCISDSWLESLVKACRENNVDATNKAVESLLKGRLNQLKIQKLDSVLADALSKIATLEKGLPPLVQPTVQAPVGEKPTQQLSGLQAVKQYIAQLNNADFETGPGGIEISEAWLLNLIDLGNKNSVGVQSEDVTNALDHKIELLAKEYHWVGLQDIKQNVQKQLILLLQQQVQAQKEMKLAEQKAHAALKAELEDKKQQIQEFINKLTKEDFVDSEEGKMINESWLRSFIQIYKAAGFTIADNEVVGPLDAKIRVIAQENGWTGIDEFIGRVLGRIAAMQGKV